MDAGEERQRGGAKGDWFPVLVGLWKRRVEDRVLRPAWNLLRSLSSKQGSDTGGEGGGGGDVASPFGHEEPGQDGLWGWRDLACWVDKGAKRRKQEWGGRGGGWGICARGGGGVFDGPEVK